MEHLSELLQEQFNKMQDTYMLFKSSVQGDKLIDLYMKGFGNDPIYLSTESSFHRCNCCFSFIRRYAGIVAVDKELNLMTIFDIQNVPDEYKESFRLMREALLEAPIKDVFKETFDDLNNLPYEKVRKGAKDYALGTAYNGKQYVKADEIRYNGAVKDGETRTFHHLHLRLANLFVDTTGKSVEAIQAIYRDDKNVFKRLMDEIPVEKMELVKELAGQGSLLNIDSHMPKIDAIIPLAKEYQTIPAEKKDNWCWVKSHEFRFARTLNDAIGQGLLVPLAEDKENLQVIAEKWNKMVDPANYMKAKSVITKSMIENAQKFVQQNGYEESFNRRMATLDDINASEILHLNTPKGIKAVSIFDTLKQTAAPSSKGINIQNLPEMGIDDFMKNILPNAEAVELYLENRLSGNFVTMTTAADGKQHTSKQIFKWPNNFSWTYNGNLAGKSQIKQAVKSAGGFVDAPFRCSIIWNEEGDAPETDLDLHCEEPRDHVFYGNHNIRKDMAILDKVKSKSGGCIDVDIRVPRRQSDNGVAVENIFYKEMSTLKDGDYHFFIHNFNGLDNNGARAEIFIDGKTYLYEIKHRISGNVDIATIHIEGGKVKKIDHSKYKVLGQEESVDIYGLKSCEFHKVRLMCLSPNYWKEPGVGNKHYFFMLDGAKSPVPLRSFHNENLKSDLLQHRKVMDILGDTLKVESVDGQLSGVGFNATVRDEVVLRVKGGADKLIKVKF